MKGAGRYLVLLFSLPLTMLNCLPAWAEGNVWTRAGLEGLNISALAVDPSNPGTIYAGIDGTGPAFTSSGTGVHVFKSTDGGISWNEVSNGLPPPPAPGDVYPRMARVSSLVVDSNNSNTVYAGIFSVYWTPGWVHDAPSLFKSTDGGANWTRADSGLPAGLLGDFVLAADPQNPNTLYAASGDSSQVYKTTDGGTSWNPTVRSPSLGDYLLDNFHSALAVDPRHADTVYLGLYGGGLFKSADGGVTWSEAIKGPLVVSDNLTLKTEHALMGVSTIAIDPQSPDTIYVGTTNLCGCMDEPLPTGIWKSTDGGASWNASNLGLPPANSVEVAWPITKLAVHPDSAGTVYAAITGFVLKSTNGGENWVPLRDSLDSVGVSVYITSLALTSARPSVLYTGSSRQGAFKITDQIPVLSVNSRYCTTSPWTLTVVNGAPNATMGLIGTSDGQPWEVAEWGKTDANGTYIESGAFTEQVRGSYTLMADIGGAHSNVFSFAVSDCDN